MPTQARVTYIDAGTVVEGSDHTYTDTLPCLTDEPCTGPVVNGVASNIVRSTDGTHFCPSAEGDKEGVIGGCTVYSSGAYRFAKAMVEALVMRQRRPDTEGRTLRVGLAAARWPTFRSTDRPTAQMTRRANGVDPTTTAGKLSQSPNRHARPRRRRPHLSAHRCRTVTTCTFAASLSRIVAHD